jgi:hypothetical protein
MTQQINLYNPQFERQKQVLTAPSMAAALGVLVFGLACMGGYANWRVMRLQADTAAGAKRLDAAKKRAAQAAAEFAPRAIDTRLSAELLEAQGEHAALVHVADAIRRGDLGDTHGYADTFRALARQNVEGLWLTGVSVAGAGTEIGIRGRTLDAALVPGYLAHLRNERALQGKAVGSMVIGQAAAIKVRGADGKETEAPAPYVEFSLQSAPAGASTGASIGVPGGQP